MRVDRDRFLLLAAAIAAESCNTPPQVATPPGVVDVPLAPPTATAPVASSAPSYGTPASEGGSGGSAGEGTCSIANASGSPADCKLLRAPPAPHCESFSDTVQECEDMRRLFKPAVAERAVRCLVEKSGTSDICRFAVAAICASHAFRESCAEASTRDACHGIAERCAHTRTSSAVPRVNEAECQGALAAVDVAQRPAMLSCMSEGCTAGYCFSYLK